MKIAKKSLSVFLSFLMVFSACSIGLTGITSFAAAGDSAYTHAEVVDLMYAAIDGGYSYQSSGDATNISGDDGSVLAAAEAIFDYAVKTYREGKKADSANNSSDTLLSAFVNEFAADFPNTADANAALALATDVLNPNGTTLYGYPTKIAGTTLTEKSSTWTIVNIGVDPVRSEGEHSNEDWIQPYYNSSVKDVTKTVDIGVNLEKLLLTYDSLADVPATIIRSVSYTYAHAIGKYAYTTNAEKSSGSWIKTKWYESTTTTSSWNYMSGKPVRTIVKDKVTKKQLLAYEKYFSVDRLDTTLDELLAMPLADLEKEYTLATGYRDAILSDFSKNIIDHFGLNYDGILAYVENLEFAYNVVAGMHAIDTLNEYIGSEYNKESYEKMAELYTKVKSAYDVVATMQDEVRDYILNEYDYTDEYASVDMAASKAYIDELHDIMTEQRLEELVASMTAKYNQYYSLLDKEDIETPTDDEIIELAKQVEAFNNVLALYPGYDYYRTYFTTEHEAAWSDFSAKVNEVAEVRNLKIDYKDNFYNFFYPLLYTTAIVDLDDEGAMALYENTEVKLEELEDYYDEIVEKYGNDVIADKIFTINYEGSDDLLQTLVENSKTAGLNAVKDNLVDRTEADLDAVEVYKNVTVVNFDNFADIKSTLSHFNYDLYNYVTGGNRTGENWLSTEYQNKYSQVQTLLDKYHAFSTSSGKDFFDEDFTFADGNGNYADRYAGDQQVEIVDDETGELGYEQIGYPNDIARDEEDKNGDGVADDNYYVSGDVLEETVVRIDNFIASRDFGALLGFVDEDTEESTDLRTYVNQMLNNSVFTSELLNTLIVTIYPMVCDMLATELPKALEDLGTPNDPGASAAIDASTLTDLIGGILNIYIDDDEKTLDGSQNGRYQRYLYEVFESADLYIYPRSFAKYLNISNPATFKAGNELYDALIAADRDWNYFMLEDDLLDEETGDVIAEEGTVYIGYDWGIDGDRDAFLDSIGYIFDSILPLLQVLMLGTEYSEELENAAYVWGYADAGWLGEHQLGAYGTLTLRLACRDINGNLYSVWNSVILPLFQTLGIDNAPTLKAGFSGDELAKALLGTLLDRVDEILASPLDSILSILPNLVYFISMDSVQEILDNININVDLGIGASINSDDSGAIGDIVGWLGDAFNFLDNLTSFEIDLKINELLDLYDLLGFEITDFNAILEFAMDALGLGLKLPPMKQQEIIFCSDWTTRADGSVNLVANKADLMYWFLNYVVSAIADGTLIDALLGDTEIDPTLQGILQKVVVQIAGNSDGALAAIVELLNPVEYELEEMDWIEKGAWDYDGIEGANQMSIVYLNYGNDWTREDANYLVDNIDSIVAAILDMTGVEIDDLGAYLADMVNGLFTNDNITALVKILGGLGDSASAVIKDVLVNQIGIDLESWFIAFGYLFPEGTWKEDAEIIPPTSQFYVNNFGVEGVANADGTISWYFNKMPLVDGDGYTFVNILTRLLGGMSLAIEFLFAGENISAFKDLITVNGYESYESHLGLLLTVLGVENLPTQADFKADAMGSFTNMLTATLDWFYALTSSDDMIKTVLELIPDVFYFIESNGLATMLHNLLMPVLVLVDTVRPILDVNISGVLSYIISDFLNYGEIDIDGVLQYVVDGINVHFNDLDYVWYSVDIDNLRLSDLIPIADAYIGTNLYESGLVQIGIKGLCSGVEPVTGTAVGDIYRTTVTAADAITIIITAFIDCLAYPAKDATKTNGDALFGFIAEMTENENLADMYTVISEIINGIVYEYDSPNWGYMFESSDLFSLTLPKQTIVYLGYNTDWTEETADSVYNVLDEVLDLVLPEVLDEGETLATLLNGLLTDNVYTDEILNTVIEAIVGLLVNLDATLFDLVDVVVDTDITAWFDMCNITTDEEGKKVVECTENWGIDAAAEADKKNLFIAGIKKVLEPANELLAWLFFGAEYAFFTSSEVDENGDYTYADLITLNGGEGYAYGLVPIFEALGCTMQSAETFYDANAGTYNVGAAVESILNSVLALVDEITANPIEEVFTLLPNIIYFVNADGLVVSVNNLLAPVNAILEKLSPVVGDISIGGLLTDAIGFDICNITMETLLSIAVDNDIVISDEMIFILSNLYVGKLAEFTSANGRTAYKLDVTGYEGDVLTLVLSIALDLFNLNADLFSDLLGKETYYAVYGLIKGASEEFVYRDMNWSYMYSGEDADSQLYNNGLPERTEGAAYEVYTKYQNNWNKATADYVDNVLDKLVNDITTAVRDDGSSLGKILDDAIVGGLYQDDILNSMISALVELMVDYEEIIKGAGVLLGAESISEWFDYCTITTDENGDTVVTCDKDWGIDSAETNDAKRTAFVEGFVTALKPAYRLLAWLLFEEDYTFLEGTTGDPLITITGGAGYANAFVPLLEALGASMNTDGTYYNGKSAIKSAEDFYVNGKLDMEQAVRDVFGALTDCLYDICGDLANQGEDGALGSMLEKLPNFLYFVNADGLKVVVNNLLVPVNSLLDALEPMGVKLDLNELIGMDITNFDFYSIFDLLEEKLGLYFPDYTQEFLATFYIGKVVKYESATGELAYYMTYSNEETRGDMITCLISFVVDAFQDPRNDEVLIGWMGEDIYNGIIAVLGLQGVKEMQKFDWLYTEYADTDRELNATETSKKYDAAYNNIWTRDKAEYIADNLLPFVSNILGLIGLEINGVEIKSIDDLLDSLLEGNLYTQATVDSLLETIRDLIAQISELEPYGEYITGVLNTAFGVDLTAWDRMNPVVEDGNRDSFVAALEEMVAPIVPLLNVFLCGENIELFYSLEDNGEESVLIIYGSEGYAYGIVPIFEALGCTMMAPEEFKALSNEDKVGAIIDSLLDRVDVILQDPVNEIFAMLPEIIYFINSNGLDTSVNNILNSVDTVLIALEPLVGATSLMELLGVDLAEYNFDYIINMACDAIEDSTGLDVEPLILDFAAELTMGKVYSYQSANGETYYKMAYAGENQFADMITVLLRVAVDWLATGDNADAVIALIENNAESEEAANSANTLIKLVLQGLNTEPALSGSMAVLYYVFYGLNNAADGLDTLYGNYGESWDSLVDLFGESEDATVEKVGNFLSSILKEFGGIDVDSSKDSCDCNCHSNSSFIRFFFKIANFFRRLFGMNEFKTCECGDAHW